MQRAHLTGALVGAAATLTAQRAARARPLALARMAGSSIAGPDAAGWMTDFLNAAYYARPPQQRTLDDLRLGFAIVTTRWHQLGRRLRAHDVLAFHRAFGRLRLADSPSSPRGTLTRDELLRGGDELLGGWFSDAVVDDARRGWGIAFPTVDAKAAYRPEMRLELAKLGPLTPPSAPIERQIWHTYRPVRMPENVLSAVTAPEMWPDYASELGRFTPLRRGGLADQTFEIEVVGLLTSRSPVWLRAYVTVTRLVTVDDPAALRRYVDELNAGLTGHGRGEPPAVPAGAEPLAAFDLTVHEHHFMGNARNRLVLYLADGRPHLRAAGTWDPMPLHLAQLYERFGHYAQHAFWGMESDRESMLHQIAEQAARRA